MSILHVFKSTNKKFYKPYIEFINENFESKEHYFIIEDYNHKSQKDFYENNLEYIYRSQYMKLILKLNKYDKIILHSLLSPKLLLMLFLQPWILKKCYWVIWGADLYYYRDREKNMILNIYETLRRVVIKRIGNLCTLVKGDYDLAKKWYNAGGKYYKAIYPNFEKINYMNKIISKEGYFSRENPKLRIVVGNSASSTNNHLAVLDILKRFKNKNIEIICPLSYGDMEYANKVKTYGIQIFNEKFVALNEFMDMKDYIKFLSDTDVGIYNLDRQQGLGNIYAMLNLGKKVILRKGTTMWKEINKMGFDVFDIDYLEKCTFQDLGIIQKQSVYKNIEISKKRTDKWNFMNIWEKIFNS